MIGRKECADCVVIYRQHIGDGEYVPVYDDTFFSISSLEPFAWGSSCCVYKIVNGPHSGKILKEYYPTFSDRQEHTRNYYMVNGEKKPGEVIVNDCKGKTQFLSLDARLKRIQEQYRRNGANLFETQELWETSLGLCYLCSDLKGKPVVDKINELKNDSFLKRLNEALFLSYFLFNDILEYHRIGFCHLDISENNIFCISTGANSEKGYLCNSIDIGSCREGQELVESLLKSAYSGSSIRRMRMEFFPSTAAYYSHRDVEAVINYCLNVDVSIAEKTKRIQALDVKAGITIFLNLLLPGYDIPGYHAICEPIEQCFEEIVREPRNTHLSLWYLEVYFRLKALLKNTFAVDFGYDLLPDIEKVRQSIMELITFLKRRPFLCDYLFGEEPRLEGELRRIANYSSELINCAYLAHPAVSKAVYGNQKPSFRLLLHYCKTRETPVCSVDELNKILIDYTIN